MKAEGTSAYTIERGGLAGPVSVTIPCDVVMVAQKEWKDFRKVFLILLDLHKEECDEKNCTVIIHARSFLTREEKEVCPKELS